MFDSLITSADAAGWCLDSVQNVRALVARKVEEHPDKYLPFFIDGQIEMDCWVERINVSQVWGDEFALQALVEATGFGR